jgi:tRNA A37 threonylcarbamoyladenosine synthetase subunit TsaC/SUA5/YrdC
VEFNLKILPIATIVILIYDTHYNRYIKKNKFLKMNLVAIPTETVYGLAGNIYRKIQKYLKQKKTLFNPLIVHILQIN